MKRTKIALKVFILPSIVFAGLLWAIVWANGSKEPESTFADYPSEGIKIDDITYYSSPVQLCIAVIKEHEERIAKLEAGFESLKNETCSSGSIDKCDWTCIAHRAKPDPNALKWICKVCGLNFELGSQYYKGHIQKCTGNKGEGNYREDLYQCPKCKFVMTHSYYWDRQYIKFMECKGPPWSHCGIAPKDFTAIGGGIEEHIPDPNRVTWENHTCFNWMGNDKRMTEEDIKNAINYIINCTHYPDPNK